jgi:hypothetical protein
MKNTPVRKTTPQNRDRACTCRHLQNYTRLIRSMSPNIAQAEEALRIEKQLDRRIQSLRAIK